MAHHLNPLFGGVRITLAKIDAFARKSLRDIAQNPLYRRICHSCGPFACLRPSRALNTMREICPAAPAFSRITANTRA